jgi:hypothetical protein
MPVRPAPPSSTTDRIAPSPTKYSKPHSCRARGRPGTRSLKICRVCARSSSFPCCSHLPSRTENGGKSTRPPRSYRSSFLLAVACPCTSSWSCRICTRNRKSIPYQP